MTKARTLADFISDGSPLADGTISVAEVSGAAPLANPTFTGTVTSTGDIALGDLDELILGSNKMRLYYDNNNNYTVLDSNGTQGFRFIGTTNLSVEVDGSEVGFFSQGAVTISPNGTEKLQVYSGGSIFSGNLKVNDDIKLGFGQFGTDLEIYHDAASTTNKLVGDLTQTGRLTTDAADLAAIAASITDTAVDVFVYDTSKDSDGGAWRKRTQHTSWYNEAASATRGSRKEFPAVAVIVAESTQVTIYDGDDPSLPMWMVFNQGGSWSGTANLIMPTSVSDPVAISLLNGVLSIPFSNGYGFGILNFISEHNVTLFANVTQTYRGNISQRNDQLGFSVSSDTRLIVNSAINDVAMTVLPNAPIDAATGLPVPTIAIASNGGVSVIKDDGTVVDITGSQGSAFSVTTRVSIDNNNVYFVGPNTNRCNIVKAIPSSDTTFNSQPEIATDKFALNEGDNSTLNGVFANGILNVTKVEGMGDNAVATNGDSLNLFSDATGNQTGMAAYVASSYNTGWMNGDIKLATLSDTDDTDVTGSNLIVNGDFSSNSDWNLASGFYSIGSGVLTSPSSGSTALRPSVNVVPVVGKTYTLTFDITAHSAGTIYVNFGHIWVTSGYSAAGVGSKSFTFTPTSTAQNFSFYTAAFGGSIDNVVLREAEADRSVNGNGLQVFGTITKTAVATGADLVGYSGFSTTGAKNNYLQQPYNSDLDFDTTFCFMTWVKVNAAVGSQDQHFFDLSPADGSGRVNVFWQHSGTKFTFAPGNSGAGVSTPALGYGIWHQVVCLANSSSTQIYLDGALSSTGAGGFNQVLQPDAYLTIGARFAEYSGNAYGLNGSVALMRLSKTTPSPEQIAKIYNDEKHLFQTGAQATLYGASDAVTALAHDDTTDLLHVGTSAGRSVFQGLRRVDNTTDAVGAAISASNGLVAEE
tara:strand:+ start:94 stop:2862 length:2769 start_codon:yes stop_codon:yes gene_type:complete